MKSILGASSLAAPNQIQEPNYIVNGSARHEAQVRRLPAIASGYRIPIQTIFQFEAAYP